jgi:hypothetical protein
MGDAGGGGLLGVEPRGSWIERDDGCGGSCLVGVEPREELDQDGRCRRRRWSHRS